MMKVFDPIVDFSMKHSSNCAHVFTPPIERGWKTRHTFFIITLFTERRSRSRSVHSSILSRRRTRSRTSFRSVPGRKRRGSVLPTIASIDRGYRPSERAATTTTNDDARVVGGTRGDDTERHHRGTTTDERGDGGVVRGGHGGVEERGWTTNGWGTDGG